METLRDSKRKPTHPGEVLREDGTPDAARKGGDYIPFEVENYVDNPVALARIKARVTQEELAQRMGVTQAYISKVENQSKVTPKLVERVAAALRKK